MAEYGSDDKQALERLAQAEDSLTHRQSLAASDLDEERARIVRVRAKRSLQGGQAEAAQTALNQLGELAARNHDSVIQECWHGAAGEMLAAKGNFKGAIAELEEDQENPESLFWLVRAYKETAATDLSRTPEDRLRTTYQPTLEQTLSDAHFREQAC